MLLSLLPISLGELRQHALTPLLNYPLFSNAEQVRATHFAHECEDVARLIRWGDSVRAEIARRKTAARAAYAHRRRHGALRNKLRQLHPTRFRGHSPRRPVPVQPANFVALDRADRRTGTFDRAAAARFQPADSLTAASLLQCKSK